VHELAIMQAIIEQVTERLGDRRVTAIHLAVGKMSGVVPDALRFSFDVATEGTTLAGATLTIDEPPGRAHCRSCGADFEVDDGIPLCACGSADVAVWGGDELLIHSVSC